MSSKKEEDARARIIKASMIVFARHGYQKASISSIAAEAGVSKSLIYHYFDSKLSIFSNTFDQALNILADDLLTKIDYHNRDVLSRIDNIIKLKIRILERSPSMFDFLTKGYLEEAPQVKNYIESIKDIRLSVNVSKAMENIDYTLFKDGIDPAIALNSIIFTLEKITEAYIRNTALNRFEIKDLKAIDELMKPYYTLFRTTYFK